MAKRSRLGFGLAALALAISGGLACASDSGDGALEASALPRLPEAQLAADPAPDSVLTVAALAAGGIIDLDDPAASGGLADGGVAAAELPRLVVTSLGRDFAGEGSLELDSGRDSGGVPISIDASASFLGDPFALVAPDPAPPAAPAFD